jgi:hypothetical protein
VLSGPTLSIAANFSIMTSNNGCGPRVCSEQAATLRFAALRALWLALFRRARLRLLLLLYNGLISLRLPNRSFDGAGEAGFCQVEYLGAQFGVFGVLRLLNQSRGLSQVLASLGHGTHLSPVSLAGCDRIADVVTAGAMQSHKN